MKNTLQETKVPTEETETPVYSNILARHMCPSCRSGSEKCEIVFMRSVGRISVRAVKHVETLCASIPLAPGANPPPLKKMVEASFHHREKLEEVVREEDAESSTMPKKGIHPLMQCAAKFLKALDDEIEEKFDALESYQWSPSFKSLSPDLKQDHINRMGRLVRMSEILKTTVSDLAD